MRKILISLLALVLGFQLNAVPVKSNDARTAAKNWLASQTGTKSNLTVKSEWTATKNGAAVYYAFNFAEGGFVLIAADDVSLPVLGYSTEGELPQNPDHPAVKEWLNGYASEITSLVNAGADRTVNSGEWSQVLTGRISKSGNRAVVNLVKSTWDQGYPYNMYCPKKNSQSTYVGCVATATAQVVRFWNYPAVGAGNHSYQWDMDDTNASTNQTVYTAFDSTYNWANMPLTMSGATTAQKKEIAKLSFKLGVAVDMDYGVSGSGAQTATVVDALKNYFNYKTTAEMKSKDSYDDAGWIALLKAEIDAGRPMVYAGSMDAEGNGGHAFVCSGYDASTTPKFHFNWGWSGSGNGYFAIGALNTSNGSFNFNNRTIIGIEPKVSYSDEAYKIMSNKLNPDSLADNPLLAYNWIDIEATGTPVTGLGDDGVAGPFALGSDFTYFKDDHKVNKFWIGDNGHVNFKTSAAHSATFKKIPTAAVPNDYIAAFCGDYMGTSNGAELFYKVEADKFIVTWKNFKHWQQAAPGYTGSITFQLIVYKDGNWKVQFKEYSPMNWLTPGGTTDEGDPIVGCENSSGALGYAWLNYNDPISIRNEILNNGTTFLPGLSVLGKFTHKHPPITDVAVEMCGVENKLDEYNKGKMVGAGSQKIQAKITNVGNVGIASFKFKAVVKPEVGTSTTITEQTFATELESGQSAMVTLDLPYNFVKTAAEPYKNYLITGTVTVTGDQVSDNNILASEVSLVDGGTNAYRFGWTKKPATTGTMYPQVWGFGSGGIDFVAAPEAYPVRVDSLVFYGARTNEPVGADKFVKAQAFKVLANGMIDATPLTAELTFDMTSIETGAFGTAKRCSFPVNTTLTEAGTGVAIKIICSTGLSTFVDSSAPFSRRNYENPEGTSWTPYRDNEAGDIVAYVVWQHASIVGIDKENSVSVYSLQQNYPNPFNPTTAINFNVNRDANVAVKVFDATGREVADLFKGMAKSGSHTVQFNANGLASGVYFYKLIVEGQTPLSKKMIFIK